MKNQSNDLSLIRSATVTSHEPLEGQSTSIRCSIFDKRLR